MSCISRGLLTIQPDNDAVEELKLAWSWLLPETYRPVLFSALGDMFLEVPSGDILWLNTGTAELSKVADGLEDFERRLDTDEAANWFLPQVVSALIAAGKVLKPGQCYSYGIVPVFREGTYTVDNLNPLSAREHFGVTGHVHKQTRDLKDGEQVRIRIGD